MPTVNATCLYTDNRVKFQLNTGSYQNIITFLESNNILFLAKQKIDFSEVPTTLHGKGKSENLLEYLSNNNKNDELLLKFMNYFISIKSNIKYYPDKKLNFKFDENSGWQNIKIEIFEPIPITGLPSLNLIFDRISHASLMISGDASNVSDWNRYFDLPNYGTSFSSVKINGNTVNLIGGNNIRIKEALFYSISLLSIVDTANCIISADANSVKCPNIIELNLPYLGTAGNNCFSNCVSLINLNLPNLTSAGESCFYNCTSIKMFNLPILLYAGYNCFYNCISATYFYLPSVTIVGNNCFGSCTQANTIILSVCVNLGSTTLNNNVFNNISGNTINLYIPEVLMICNDGNPDEDIIYIQNNNNVTLHYDAAPTTTTTTTIAPITTTTTTIIITGTTLDLTFSNIIQTENLLGDLSNVSTWNTFFDLPINGIEFTSVTVTGNLVSLVGGHNIHIKNSLMSGPTIESIVDVDSIISLGDECFAYSTVLLTVELPLVTSIGNTNFAQCELLSSIKLPSLITAGEDSFSNCPAVIIFDLPYLETAGIACFQACTLATFNLPSLITAGDRCFVGCVSELTFDFPLLETAGNYTFACAYESISPTYNLPSLATAGDHCFEYSSISTLSALTSAGNYCFAGCTSTFIDMPLLSTAGDGAFSGCLLVTSFNLPSLTMAGQYCFQDCLVTSFNLPSLVEAKYFCFSACLSALTFNLPSLITAGQYCFSLCTSVRSFNISSCINLGNNNYGLENAFSNITGNIINLFVPVELLTINGGSPHYEIDYLQRNNTVTINPAP